MERKLAFFHHASTPKDSHSHSDHINTHNLGHSVVIEEILGEVAGPQWLSHDCCKGHRSIFYAGH